MAAQRVKLFVAFALTLAFAAVGPSSADLATFLAAGGYRYEVFNAITGDLTTWDQAGLKCKQLGGELSPLNPSAPGRGTRPTTSTLDLDTGVATYFNPMYNPGCSGQLTLEDGRIILFGGDTASIVRNMSDGRDGIARFEPSSTTMTRVSKMQKRRWYVLIVGGSGACNAGPIWDFAEVWNPLAPTVPTTKVALPPTFEAAMGYNWYPTILLMRFGHLVWFANTRGAVTDKFFNVIVDLPPIPVA
ncbi:hypothetical protein TSOC_006899 [Tetrabaena socialis]|uniref:C-type lectin domain-containing protein n=1 Tax=Tetrabaena socialis TaxID=47790 RepID=A0A2J8A2F4_9CHLO|nr:hypothetical protein TSOC_006899 [Tetrabaena socialis]|eukprot:PNH06693.1 hypothetical protein TSOC_006899 [Tetrabaena socialis]